MSSRGSHGSSYESNPSAQQGLYALHYICSTKSLHNDHRFSADLQIVSYPEKSGERAGQVWRWRVWVQIVRIDFPFGPGIGWAIESSLAAAKTGYVGLTTVDGNVVQAVDVADSQDKDDPTKCNAEAQQRILALKIHPDADYRSNAEAVIEERFKEAGVRLAKLLNDTWPEDAAAPHSAFHRSRRNQ